MKFAGDDPVATLDAARSIILASFAPVPIVPEQRDEWAASLAFRLDPIAAKIAPTMSVEQGRVWREAMILALSNLPAMISLTAAKRALHRPISFISDVDGVIRAAAEEITHERTEALRRIERLIRELQAASEPKLPAAEPEPVEPITEEARIRTNAYLRRIGVRTQLGADGETYELPDDDVGDEEDCSGYVPSKQEAA